MKTGATNRARATIPADVSAASSAPVISTPPSELAHVSLTKPIYRTLLIRGFRPTEAANLTAFLCGIRVGDHQWKLDEVNRLLFLRELQATGRYSVTDGTTHVS
jgi:hypothetical protein